MFCFTINCDSSSLKQTDLFTAVYLCAFQLLLLCRVLVAIVRSLTPHFSWYSVFHLLLSTCKTKWSAENLFHLSRNNRWRMICKLNVLYEVTVAELEMIALSGSDMKIGFLNANSGRVYFQVFHPAAFLSLIRPNVPLASCLASSCFSLCTTLSSLFCILYLVFL